MDQLLASGNIVNLQASLKIKLPDEHEQIDLWALFSKIHKTKWINNALYMNTHFGTATVFKNGTLTMTSSNAQNEEEAKQTILKFFNIIKYAYYLNAADPTVIKIGVNVKYQLAKNQWINLADFQNFVQTKNKDDHFDYIAGKSGNKDIHQNYNRPYSRKNGEILAYLSEKEITTTGLDVKEANEKLINFYNEVLSAFYNDFAEEQQRKEQLVKRFEQIVKDKNLLPTDPEYQRMLKNIQK